MTTQLTVGTNPLRLTLKARDKLQQDSDIMIDQPRAIDNQRITSEPLTTLSKTEMTTVECYMKIILGMDDV